MHREELLPRVDSEFPLESRSITTTARVSPTECRADAFPASRAWLYVAIVGVGYMVSRGLAKAGSRDPLLG